MSTCSLSLVKHGHAKYAFSNNKYLQFNIQFNLVNGQRKTDFYLDAHNVAPRKQSDSNSQV